jgi:membrane protein
MLRSWLTLQVAFERYVWETDLARARPAKAGLIQALRIVNVVWRDISRGPLSPQAMSLVYTALLALIPLLAVSFSILKTFGVHNQIRPILLNFLAPLGDKGVELTNQLLTYVSKMRVGVLGALGLGLLVYTSLLLIHKIDQSFNTIWRVKRGRRFARRLGDYLTVTVVGPLLFLTALGITASITSSALLRPFGGLSALVQKGLPYILGIGAFAFLYVFIPNTKVRLRSALIGAVVAGVLWQSAGQLFAAFIASSGQYRAVYASFAILIFFMIWLYMSFLITLVGASIAFYHQHPEHLSRDPRETSAALSNRLRERLGLRLARVIAQQYFAGRPPLNAEALARRLHAPLPAIEQLLVAFLKHDLLIATRSGPDGYVPARPLETVGLTALWRAIRTAGHERVYDPPDKVVDELLAQVTNAEEQALTTRTWRDLVIDEPVAVPVPNKRNQLSNR